MIQRNEGRFRPRKTKFAQVSNAALHDDKLSLKAKGLYSLIQSLITMPDADLSIWKIKLKCKEGSKAFDAAWKELKDCGYLKQYRMPTGERGKFKYEYDLLEEPDLTTSATINLNKNGEIVSITEEIDHIPQNGGSGQEAPDDHTPHFGCYAQSTLCFKHPVENGGGNDNTVPDNTVLDNTKSVSPSYNDGLTDFLSNQIKEQIEYRYFEQEMPDDILTITALVDCMVEIMASPETKINGVSQSRQALAPYIAKVDSCTIREFMEHMRGKSLKGVKNITAYYRSCFINYLREQELSKMVI
ncbi:hypothetical protein [Faecalispora sporosphaeroides]|uniref:hypothetical protein n=1 Tax=Faecalispora sporosphaeroides TaxID=1549 RepID=UPI000370138A|nr:hypothetical protein [Faecalispora sporosphaeroides]